MRNNCRLVIWQAGRDVYPLAPAGLKFTGVHIFQSSNISQFYWQSSFAVQTINVGSAA